MCQCDLGNRSLVVNDSLFQVTVPILSFHSSGGLIMCPCDLGNRSLTVNDSLFQVTVPIPNFHSSGGLKFVNVAWGITPSW